jgi:hypothetical protein
MPERINQEGLRRLPDSRWSSDAPWDQEHDTNAFFSIQRLVKQSSAPAASTSEAAAWGTVSQCTARNEVLTIPQRGPRTIKNSGEMS